MINKHNKSQILSWLFFLVVLTSPKQSHAVAGGPDYYRIKSDEPVNVYERDNKESKILGTIPVGTGRLKNLGCSGITSFDEWIKMSPEEQTQAKEKNMVQGLI